MKCDKQLLEQYVDDFLSQEEREQVDEHVAKCAVCQQMLKELQQEQLELIGVLNRPTLRKSLADDIMDQLEAPIIKKRRWQMPLTVAATAILAVGLVYLNKESLLHQSEVIEVLQPQIVIDQYNVEVGIINIDVIVKDEHGKPAELDNLLDVKVFQVDSLDSKIDITENTEILVRKEGDTYKYVIQLDDLKYDFVELQFSADSLQQAIQIDASSVEQVHTIDDYIVEYQGKREVDGVYDIYYRTRFTDELSRQYEKLDRELMKKFDSNYYSNTNVGFNYELIDANGKQIISTLREADVQTNGIAQFSQATNTFSEHSVTLKLPKKNIVFPLTMRIYNVQESIPENIEIPMTKDTDSFEFYGEVYKIIEQRRTDEGYYIEMEGPDSRKYPNRWMVKVGDNYYKALKGGDTVNNKPIYTLLVPEIQQEMNTYDLVINNVYIYKEIQPYDIIIK